MLLKLPAQRQGKSHGDVKTFVFFVLVLVSSLPSLAVLFLCLMCEPQGAPGL